MKTNVSCSAFSDAFRDIRPDNFTYDGITALYKHFIEMEGDIGEEIELDVIALCCEYTEYSSIQELNKDRSGYGPDDYETEKEALEALENDTTVIYNRDDRTGESGFIILDF